MEIIKLEEALTYVMLEACIEHLGTQNVKSASHNEKINKLQAIRKKYLEGMTEQFLNSTP